MKLSKYFNRLLNECGIVYPLLIIFAAGLLISLMLINTSSFKNSLLNSLFPKSASYAAGTTGPTRGLAGDLWADIIIGKPQFSEVVPNTVVGNKFFYPTSVIIDTSSTPNHLYIYDGVNSRIIGIFDASRCASQAPNCSVNSSQGDIVIGQPGFNTASCNGDSGFQTYPNIASASASSFCNLPEGQLSIGEHETGSNMYISPQSDLYVTDFENNRVLKYTQPFKQSKGISIIASDVWGQTDFTGNLCNKGGSPDATTLCFGWNQNNHVAGVDVDSNGNVWVADIQNNRVLRFPGGSHTADIVLGQPSFSSVQPPPRATAKGVQAPLSALWAPGAVRVISNGSTETVYVADYFDDRILVYSNIPTSTYSTPLVGPPGVVFASVTPPTNTCTADASDIPSGTDPTMLRNFCLPTGLDFDNPQTPIGIWVAQGGYQDRELWDLTKQTVVKTLGTFGNGNVLNNPIGSMGIDSSGNYFTGVKGGNWGNNVVYFPSAGPFNTPSQGLFALQSKGTANLINANGMGSGQGVSIYESQTQSQLIALDGQRVIFWNNLSTLSNGKAADGVVELNASDFSDYASSTGLFSAMKASSSYLYVGRGRNANNNPPQRIEIYKLPLTDGEKPLNTFISYPLNVLGGGQITQGNIDSLFWGMVPASDDSYLWVSDASTNRAFRIRNPLTNPVVDVILGQPSISAVSCNQGGPVGSGATPQTLCQPGAISLDKLGNLYVSDQSLEANGNGRLLEFNSSLFPANNTSVIYAPAASKIFPNTASWEPAFDSQNHMVVGYNPILQNPPISQGGHFAGVYLNPVSSASATPDETLNDYTSMGFGASFDSNNNLYLSDLDRSRILIYMNPLNIISNTPTPIPQPSNTPTSTPIPSATPTPTLTPTPTFSPTSTPLPTPTPTNIPTSTPTATPTPVDITPPTVPGGLSATAVSSSQINLSWNVSTDPDSPVAGYIVRRNGVVISNSITTTNFGDTGLNSSTTYTYTVAAYDPSNNISSQSQPVSATTLPANIKYGTFAGTVTHASTGLPFANVKACIGSGGSCSSGYPVIYTTSNGYYSIPIVPPGTYNLRYLNPLTGKVTIVYSQKMVADKTTTVNVSLSK